MLRLLLVAGSRAVLRHEGFHPPAASPRALARCSIPYPLHHHRASSIPGAAPAPQRPAAEGPLAGLSIAISASWLQLGRKKIALGWLKDVGDNATSIAGPLADPKVTAPSPDTIMATHVPNKLRWAGMGDQGRGDLGKAWIIGLGLLTPSIMEDLRLLHYPAPRALYVSAPSASRPSEAFGIRQV